MNIVVADDEPIARMMIAQALTDAGHTVHACPNGLEALRALEHGEARVLITDWEMHGLDGPELCRRVRAAQLGRYVYIVILTSRSAREDLLSALRAGADDFLTKPFDPAELHVRLMSAHRVTSLESRDLVIFALARLAESRDRETGAHLERVRVYCRELAADLRTYSYDTVELTPAFVQDIYLTSPLHDIGKVGIPDVILLKPGRLTPAEYEVMKSHTIIGGQTLGDALRQFPEATFLKMAQQIALAHHERFDGAGYPHGLKAREIPLAARITAVADIYDALRSPRIYKAAMPHADARESILRLAGTHLDPDLVMAFDRIHEYFEEVSTKLAEAHEPDDHQSLDPTHRAA